MSQERIIWAEGIDRSRDPRHIGKNSQYDAYNQEVIEQGTLSKRKGFNRWRTDGNSVIGDIIRGEALMYDSDGNRYLFVLYDGVSTGTDLWVEKAGGTPLIVSNFFPSKGYIVRWAVFGDRIYFINGVDRPRWYKEYDGSNHIWGIAGVPSPARRPADESSFDYFISRALYADTITSSQDFGIDPPGIWRYKQTIGYYGKVSDEQVEESNAGPASKMFHCQFNTAEALGTQLQGYIKKGIPIGIADFDDLILDAGESGGQDYESDTRWMRIYRRWKMFSDELYSPFEFLVELKKGWPTSIRDVYSRDSAVVAPTARVQIPVSHHIESANNRLFLGRVEKELFTQPGLPADFRSETTYKADFSYRMPITVHNTNPKTLTGAVIPLRFQDSSSSDHVATPPAGGEAWTGAYIDTSLTLSGAAGGWWQMMFVDEDGVTPLGFALLSKAANVVSFLVEIPEIATGGSRTIYLYFEDSQLDDSPTNDPEAVGHAGQPGHWQSIAHYPLCASDHWMLADFENWDAAVDMEAVTQKRSLGYIIDAAFWGTSAGGSRQTINDYFFNRTGEYFAIRPVLRVQSTDASDNSAGIEFFPPAVSSTLFSVAFLASTWIEGTTLNPSVVVKIDRLAAETGDESLKIVFTEDAGDAVVQATVWDTDGMSYALAISDTLGSGGPGCNNEFLYYLLTIDGSEFTFTAIYGDKNGHAAEGAAWDNATHYNIYTTSRNDIAKPIRFNASRTIFGAITQGNAAPKTSNILFKEMQVVGRKIDGADELLHMLHRDTYFPDFGLATVEDRESQTGEKHPDRMYFSKLNQPNSFEAIDFRDMGELGRPIQGIKGIHNRLFVFDENKIKALFSAGAEQALALASGDTRMWNLSQDLTGKIGGLGVLAPDSLVTMEFAGRDGVGFLSKRGFYFFDGNGFVHISQKVDNYIEEYSDDVKRGLLVYFLWRKRQLLLCESGPGILGRQLVANMLFVNSPEEIIWTRWRAYIKYGLELDYSIDGGDFVYVVEYLPAGAPKQILKLEGNSGANTYVDIWDDGLGAELTLNVAMECISKYFDLKDAEMLHADIENEVATPTSSYDVKLFSDISGTMAEVVNFDNPTNGEHRFPIGTNARTFMVKITENSSSAIILRTVDLYFNVHGRRRV